MRAFRLALPLTLLALLTITSPTTAQIAPFCAPGQAPQFVFGFKALSDELGEIMGEPLECEHAEAATGDAHQQTSKGLSFYRKSTNTPTFTNGWEHWALTAEGLVYWTGSSIDPPGTVFPEPLPVAPPRPVGAAATVQRVVDGDTADVQFTGGQAHRLRIIGIDTPETVDPSQPVQCYGPEASARARELLTGQTIALTADPTQDAVDRYGRVLVYVALPDGRDFGEVMVREGFAREYTYRTAYQRQATYRAAEAEARAAGRGLWGACGTAAPTAVPQPAATAVPLATVTPRPLSTTTPRLLPTATPMPVPTTAPSTGLRYDPAGPDRDCSDFRTQAEAQAFFVAAQQATGQRDKHRLDSDADGIACESLP